MANTTFTGPIRSEKGYQQISKNATTGAITVTSGDKWATEATGSAGIEGTAAVYVTQVTRLKSDVDTNVNIVKSTIMIDLTGLKDGGTAGDIIGKDGSGVAFIGRVTAANQGTVFGVTMTCLETPDRNSDHQRWCSVCWHYGCWRRHRCRSIPLSSKPRHWRCNLHCWSLFDRSCWFRRSVLEE